MITRGNVHAVPIIHYNMEIAAAVRRAYVELKPDCVAIELAQTMELQLLHAASRLPDVSIVVGWDKSQDPLYYMVEPCDAAFEAMRSALDDQVPAFCIDLDIDEYPDSHDDMPDPYAIQRIGLKEYYEAYEKIVLSHGVKREVDTNRELHMARRLKELSLSYDKILYIGGMYHVRDVLDMIDRDQFPDLKPAEREGVQLCTLTEDSCREVMAECGWMSKEYEEKREALTAIPDRQEMLLSLYKAAIPPYEKETGTLFPGYHLRNIMKFARNYALTTGRLVPDLYQLLSSAKGCVDHNYAYEVWEKATEYPHRKNLDSLNELDLSIEDVWGHSKIIRFHMRQQSRKDVAFKRRRKDRSDYKFEPPGAFTICSYPPEDLVIESFGDFLKKKGTQILTDEGAATQPFSTSLEDGIDTRETIRHWPEKKLYVKVRGKPPGGVGSVVIIFDEDKPENGKPYSEAYPWRTTWLGEHEQESDMALYATEMGKNVVGPGITRCQYGGFLMSYPPRRMFDVWSDPDYAGCRSKAEVLLVAAIDYAVKPIIVYVAAKPPRQALKSFARRFGKKVVYIPIGQLSPVTLKSIRNFHVLDGHDRRDGADEYII